MFLTGFWQPTPRKHRFQAVKTETDDDEIDSEGLISARKKTGKSAVSIPWICFTTANLVILSITVSLILSVQSTQAHEKNAILRQVSWWCKLSINLYLSSWLTRIQAPVLDDIEIPSYTTTLNGTLFALPEISIAREEPGPENDAVWAQFEKVLTHVVTRDDIIKLGKDPDTVSRFDDEYWGLGDDAYMVQLDVMHVSCLFVEEVT